MAVEKSTVSDQIVDEGSNKSTVTLAGHGLKTLPEKLYVENSDLTALDLRHNLLEPSALKEFSRFRALTCLNIADNKLGQLPATIGKLSHLEELNVVGNDLVMLPPEIGKLERLVRLYADFNQLNSVPTEITSLPTLAVLSLGHNNFITLPPILEKTRSLQILILSGNCLTCLPSNIPTTLTYLDVRANNLHGIVDVNDLKLLQHLDMSYNCIRKLQLTSLNALRFFDCSYNQLSELSVNGESLQIIVARNNRLQSVEFLSGVAKLEILDISFNQLQVIPEVICDAPQLVILDVSHNILSNISNRLLNNGQMQLQVVKLNHNRLNYFPEIINNFMCRCLHLQHNLLLSLPINTFNHGIRLEELNVSHNRLVNLPPVSVQQIATLKKLYLTSNLLNKDVFKLICKCPRLQVLHLAYNHLLEIPDSILQKLHNLHEFSVAANDIEQVPTLLTSLPLLQILHLHSNKLQCVPQVSACPNLKAIDLACNKLNQISLSSVVSPQLCYLDLSSNSQLQINPTEFHNLCSERSVAIVNVNSQRKFSVPFTSETYCNIINEEDPWMLGFTETFSGTARLCIDIEKKKHEISIAVIENSDCEQVSLIKSFLPQLLRAERSRTDSVEQCITNTILAALRLIKTKWPNSEPSITLCMLTPSLVEENTFILRLASVGQPAGCLLTDSGEAMLVTENMYEDIPSVSQDWETAIKAGFTISNKTAKTTEMFPPKRKTCFISEPQVKEVKLKNSEKHLIIGSSSLWEALEPTEIVQLVEKYDMTVHSSKHLAELSLALGNRVGACVAVIMLQLDKVNLFSNSDSNHSGEDNNHDDINILSITNFSNNITNWSKEEEDKILNDEVIEEAEKYKSWEYMLEQNHKMLFSRELETIHRSFVCRTNQVKNVNSINWSSNNSPTLYNPSNGLSSFRERYYCYGYLDKNKFSF